VLRPNRLAALRHWITYDRGSHRQPFSIDNDMGPVGTTETEAEDDVPECDDEADDDIEINSDLAKDTTEARRITNE
jgi:hypothetical protein